MGISGGILHPWAFGRPRLCIAADKGFEPVRERLPVISQRLWGAKISVVPANHRFLGVRTDLTRTALIGAFR